MNGSQLKALQCARLPESEPEWDAVSRILQLSATWLRNESSPKAFLEDLRDLAAYARDWWENRTKREGSPSTPASRAFCQACGKYSDKALRSSFSKAYLHPEPVHLVRGILNALKTSTLCRVRRTRQKGCFFGALSGKQAQQVG